nr:MAG TPA: hypothetical protein [Caudoviricetes sp.]
MPMTCTPCNTRNCRAFICHVATGTCTVSGWGRFESDSGEGWVAPTGESPAEAKRDR